MMFIYDNELCCSLDESFMLAVDELKIGCVLFCMHTCASVLDVIVFISDFAFLSSGVVEKL